MILPPLTVTLAKLLAKLVQGHRFGAVDHIQFPLPAHHLNREPSMMSLVSILPLACFRWIRSILVAGHANRRVLCNGVVLGSSGKAWPHRSQILVLMLVVSSILQRTPAASSHHHSPTKLCNFSQGPRALRAERLNLDVYWRYSRLRRTLTLSEG